LQSLPADSFFQVFSFGSTHTSLNDDFKLLPLTKENLSFALSEINSYSADLGGTMIYPALKSCYEGLLQHDQK
jgi:hypothetical protein